MDIYDLAATQHAAFGREQARELGLSDRELDGLVRRAVVERAAPGVFVVRGHEATWSQRLAVAVLSVPGSLASHRAAARLWGMPGFENAPVEILVERGHHRRTAPRGVILHETKDLRGSDVDQKDGIDCTGRVRTFVDLPAVAHPFKVGVALDRASRRDDSLLGQVLDRHRRVARRGRNGTVALRLLLAERVGGEKVDSGFERKALTLVRSSALPPPVTQHHVVADGFQCWLDIAWPAHLVAMECDSLEFHLNERAFRWERIRRRRLHALDWTVLEFTYHEVTRQGAMVVRELARHLPVA